MYEKELHDLWRQKNLPINLTLTDGKEVSIKEFGEYNESLAGPDFSMGMIRYDSIDFIGPIELHVKSSDWIKHKHHTDKSYNNVILHVVYDHDKEVYQNGRKLPTLQLKDFINVDELNSIHHSYSIPCEKFLLEAQSDSLDYAKKEAYFNKLNAKIKKQGSDNFDYSRSMLFTLLADAFGMGVNQRQFQVLAKSVPVESLSNLTQSEIEEKIVNASSVHNSNTSINWNYKGLRPRSFPEVRVLEFATIVSSLIFDERFMDLARSFNLEGLRLLIKKVFDNAERNISTHMLNHLDLNCFVPFFYYYSAGISKARLSELIVAEVSKLKAEKNKFTRIWKSIGVDVENAYDSQSLNALYKNYCSHKKCLSCSVGKRMLKRPE